MQGGVRETGHFRRSTLLSPCPTPGLLGLGWLVELASLSSAESQRCIRRTGDSTMRPGRQGCPSPRMPPDGFKRGAAGSFLRFLRLACSTAAAALAVFCCAWELLNRAAIGRLCCETRQGQSGPRGPQRNWWATPGLFRFAGTQQRHDWIKTTLDPCHLVASLRVKWAPRCTVVKLLHRLPAKSDTGFLRAASNGDLQLWVTRHGAALGVAFLQRSVPVRTGGWVAWWWLSDKNIRGGQLLLGKKLVLHRARIRV